MGLSRFDQATDWPIQPPAISARHRFCRWPAVDRQEAIEVIQHAAAPRTVDCGWDEALGLAREEREPLFLSLRPHVDDRGWSLMNLLSGALSPQGQINFSIQHPGIIKAWHRHAKQTDFWMCVHGHLKAGIHRDEDGRSWSIVFGEMKPGVLVIPPPLWHGAATVGDRPAGLMYYVTHAYDAASPDEDRRAHDSIRGFSWEVAHR